MKILLTTDTVGDVWAYSLELARALGCEVALATMGAPLSPAQARAAAALKHVTVHESSFALEWMPDAWRDVDAAGEWLLELAQLECPDVVHINGLAHAALPFALPVVCVAHSCVLTRHRAVHRREAGPEWDEYRARAGHGLRAADVVVAPTVAILDAILDAHQLRTHTRVIAHARTAAVWRPAPKEPFVLSGGTLWDEAKGLVDLDRVADHVPWPIVIAAPTRPPAGIAEVEANRVLLLGDRTPESLARWLSRAGIYALPARYEPFGLSILEAALAGCALVLGDVPTLRELWRDTALYVEPGDLDELAFSLSVLARDPLRRASLAAHARIRARQFAPERMAASYHALYAELAAAREEMSA
jgi:glycogen(starch) synthase